MAVKKKKNNCKKKTVRKEWIEDIVIREITKIIFDDNTIESIISMVMKIQEEDNKEVPMYEKQLESVKRSIENMLNAIQMGVFTKSTKQRLEELEQQKKNLEQQIAELSFKKPMLKPENIRNWLYKLRTLNPEKLEHRRVLVDTFVNKIFLYDDKIVFTFNYKSDTKEVTLKEIEVSDILTGREPKRKQVKKTCFSFAFFPCRPCPNDLCLYSHLLRTVNLHRSRSAAGGGCSEAEMEQNNEYEEGRTKPD